MAMELEGIHEWIYSVLSADSTLIGALGGTAIYRGEPPEGAAYPFVSVEAEEERVETTLNGSVFLFEAMMHVSVIGRTNTPTALEAIYSRLDTLLHGGGGTAPVRGTHVIGCLRVGDISEDEYDMGGVKYIRRGGVYRVWV